MNPLIEILNLRGGHLFSFAWPMLWQSSLLIAVIFGLDLALRHKLRPTIRYILWLMVLVKLLLPTTLASPSSLAWWLRPANPSPVSSYTQSTPYAVTYSEPATVPHYSQPQITFTPPTARLSPQGLFLLVWAVGCLVLAGWLIVRWWQVVRLVRSTLPVPKSWDEPVADLGQQAGVHGRVRIRFVEAAFSPAVCGLLRPVILLPRLLAENLSPTQLRAVLLHELIHLRRGDVWVNCAQCLLQIIYWWHPLLWLANARIRRVREEAVDDAVMLALNEEAEHYAPTLLEVAKLVLTRPLTGLGLIGILESRSALRQRIERLADLAAPRKTGLGVVSALCLTAFAAVALPMAEAPETDTNNSVSTQLQAKSPSTSPTSEVIHVDKLLIIPPPATGTSSAVPLIQITSNQVSMDRATGEIMAEGHVSIQRDRPTVNDTPEANSDKSPTSQTNLFTRTYKVDTYAFTREVQRMTGVSNTNKTDLDGETVRKFFYSAGVDLRPPKTVFLSKHGGLFVRATLADIDIIDRAIAMLNLSPPQVEIKVKFIELPADASLDAINSSASGAFTNILGEQGVSGILTANRARDFLAHCMAQPGVDLLSAPDVTTLSGRQAHIDVVDVLSILKGINLSVTNGLTNVNYVVEKEEFGPVLDIVPYVSADTHSIQLAVIPTVMEFLGYDDSRPDNLHLGTGPALPRYRRRQIATSAIVWDGQTLVLGGLMTEDVAHNKQKAPAPADARGAGRALSHETPKTVKRNLVILITPTIVDATGRYLNREVDKVFDRDF